LTQCCGPAQLRSINQNQGGAAMPEAIPQASLKAFLTTVKDIIVSPATVDRLLALIAKNEEVVERYRAEVAELAVAREQLRRERAEHGEKIAEARNAWLCEERQRREALEKDERKANAVVQPNYRGARQPEAEHHAASAAPCEVEERASVA
jgi:hypothetical protein